MKFLSPVHDSGRTWSPLLQLLLFGNLLPGWQYMRDLVGRQLFCTQHRLFIGIPHCSGELWGSIVWLKLKWDFEVLNTPSFPTAKVSNIISPSSPLLSLLHFLWRNNSIFLRFWGPCFHFLSSKMNARNMTASKLEAQSSHSKTSHFGTFTVIHLESASQTAETLSWAECGLWGFLSYVRKIWSIGWLTTDLFLFPGLNHISNPKLS